jgi:hypothetical protein
MARAVTEAIHSVLVHRRPSMHARACATGAARPVTKREQQVLAVFEGRAAPEPRARR